MSWIFVWLWFFFLDRWERGARKTSDLLASSAHGPVG